MKDKTKTSLILAQLGCLASLPLFYYFVGPVLSSQGSRAWLAGVAAIAASVGVALFGTVALKRLSGISKVYGLLGICASIAYLLYGIFALTFHL
ncbi:hypothetical protein GII36_00500 [Candidatus Mycosynbacter amalyticus]|uniref:Uncharacterized protein n=1 Tax=Candidatus Mycosynbacter amalyticus TaxID=2665156 RepID=A0A857MJL8_9BACT|nr:hypothetical protein GII36_00500 [Candidatus Mycosynbacter amalyticus]